MTLFICLADGGEWITAIFDTREAAERHLIERKDVHEEIRPTCIAEYELNATFPRLNPSQP